MSGPKRNPDKLNTIGVVVVGICGAVLVYVTIVALQAFYMDDTSEIQMMADYGGQDTQAKNIRAAQMASLTTSQPNARAGSMPQTYRIPIKQAMKKVAEEGKQDPGNLVPAIGPSNKATVQPIFGRPQPLQPQQPPAQGDDAGSAAPDQAPPAAGSATELQLQPTQGEGGGGRTPAMQTPESGKGSSAVQLPDPPAGQRPPANPPQKPPAKGNAQ